MTAPTIGPITKVSANFLPRAMVALDVAAEITGDTHTDCLNRAVQVYAYIEKMRADGKRIEIVDPATGEREEMTLL